MAPLSNCSSTSGSMMNFVPLVFLFACAAFFGWLLAWYTRCKFDYRFRSVLTAGLTLQLMAVLYISLMSQKPIESQNSSSVAIIVGSDFRNSFMDQLRRREINAQYIFVVPHALSRPLFPNAESVLSKQDLDQIMKLERFLNEDKNKNFIGAFGVQPVTTTKTTRSPRELLELSPCRFKQKELSLIIRNTGEISNDYLGSDRLVQKCNMADGPFLIRKEYFVILGLRSHLYGDAAFLDFFLRTNGEQTMAKLSDVKFSTELHRKDRGLLEKQSFYFDYFRLAHDYRIARVVRRDRIEWLKCMAESDTLCPEKPQKYRSNALNNPAMPMCCSVRFDAMLRDVVDALVKRDLDYRIVYGTLLGAIRSKTVIPWTTDVDVALPGEDFFNASLMQNIREELSEKYALIEEVIKAKPWHMFTLRRPLDNQINSKDVFVDGMDMEAKSLFSDDIMAEVRHLTFNHIPTWITPKIYNDERLCLEVYSGPRKLFFSTGTDTVTINDRSYVTMKDPKVWLAKWYGKDYLDPRGRNMAHSYYQCKDGSEVVAPQGFEKSDVGCKT